MVAFKPRLKLNNKEFDIEEVFVSELGYLMVRLYNPEEKVYTTYNLGVFESDNNIFLNEIERIQRERNSTAK